MKINGTFSELTQFVIKSIHNARQTEVTSSQRRQQVIGETVKYIDDMVSYGNGIAGRFLEAHDDKAMRLIALFTLETVFTMLYKLPGSGLIRMVMDTDWSGQMSMSRRVKINGENYMVTLVKVGDETSRHAVASPRPAQALTSG